MDTTLFKWVPGRQGSGYFKLCLARSYRFKFDIFILKYPIGSFIDWHTDKHPNFDEYNHFRFNLILKKAKKGGICQTVYPPTGKGR